MCPCTLCFFFFNDTATTEIYTLSLHDALPISLASASSCFAVESLASIASGSLIHFWSHSLERRSVTPLRSGPARRPPPMEWHPLQPLLSNRDFPRFTSAGAPPTAATAVPPPRP